MLLPWLLEELITPLHHHLPSLEGLFNRFVPLSSPSFFFASLRDSRADLPNFVLFSCSSESLPFSSDATHSLLPPCFDPRNADDGGKLGTWFIDWRGRRRSVEGGIRVDVDAVGGLDEGGQVEDEVDESDGGGLPV